MARKLVTDISAWPSLALEGNLINPAMVARIAEPKDDAETRASYGIRKGLTIREEISIAFRVGQAHFDAFTRLDNPSADRTRRFVHDFLKETFGFDDLEPGDGLVSWIGGGRVPLVVVPPAEERLDRRSPTLSTDRTRSPAFALQDVLNAQEHTLWGLATNGVLMRLMRDNASLTRPAYIEADLAQIFTNEDAASFALLWLLIHRSRFGATGTPATDCPLERWRETGAREGEAARDRLADQVRQALKRLGSGFLAANPPLAGQIQSGALPLIDWFNELLRLAYRLIFLMVAEDRQLLHPESASAEARQLYADGYSLRQLRTQCVRASTWDKHLDRYEGIKIVFRALAQGEPRLGLPALGGLFAGDQLPHLESARLSNRALMEAIYRLAWLADKSGMVPVNWRAMETEELGSVYESLLELQPQLSDDGKTLLFAAEAAEQRGNQRKTTGSYYTPDALVQAQLDTALDPVLDRIEAEASDPIAALLDLKLIDLACGSGHFLLAAARRIATRLARLRAGGAPSLADYRHALRDVARHCIHGVDRNPMAVELTKVALWIETVDPGLPLGFFDAQIRCGDSLLGVFNIKVLEDGIPDAAYQPLTGDDKPVARYYLKANRDAQAGQGGFDFGTGQASMPAIKPLALDFSGFRALPEETVAQIDAKAQRFAALREQPEFARARLAADLYMAAFLMPKTGSVPSGAAAHRVPTTAELWEVLNGGQLPAGLRDAPEVARIARAFHWPLEFPDVMERGGFDVAVGNPPWERIKLQEQEFFATRSPEIANAPNKAARDRLIQALASAAPGSAPRRLFEAFEAEKRLSEAHSAFVRLSGDQGGRFALTGTGDVNTYALFAELFANLARERAGIIVPTGIATDATTAPFFAHLAGNRRLARLVDFENRAGLFPAVDSRMKFALLTLGRNEPAAHFAFFLTDPAQRAEPERNFTLSPKQIAAINPNTRTAPVFRSRADAELTAKIYRNAPVLIDEGKGKDGNPWDVKLRTMLHKTNASQAGKLKPAIEIDSTEIGVTWIPVFEGDYGFQFDHRYGTGVSSTFRATSIAEHQNPDFEPELELVCDIIEWEKVLHRWGIEKNSAYFAGFRRVARSTDERTSIACILPALPSTYGWIIFVGVDYKSALLLIGNANSIVLDFCLRNSLSQPSIPQGIYKQLPFLPPNFYTGSRLNFAFPKILELTFTSHSIAPFARDLGYDGPPFRWDEGRRAQLRADLDAFFARAYGLTRDELRYILDPADVKGPDYPSETFRVLKDKEIRQFGEYRTRRLVLAAWDRMEAEGEFTALGL